ncbi:HIT family protein [Amycolatopsis minnesotensis]|uniref:HIT domain-containing protein n=1 Tax=Amycolatopsis minnesotensis TaxID=337894 RepID=A0ABP5CLT9_9PSEU
MIYSVQCEGADFCQEISGSSDTSFARVYDGEPPSRRIAATERFELLADMSPLVAGHILLLPKDHYLSFARVIENNLAELEDVLAQTIALYANTFTTPLILEHGSADGSDQKACITHAHWHLLPVHGADVDVVLEQEGLMYQDIDGIADLGRAPWTRMPYYFRRYAGRSRIYLPPAGHQRQYLRSVAGRALAIEDPEWDYAVVIRKDALRLTMRMTADWELA